MKSEDQRLVIGVDLGGTNMTAALVDSELTIIEQHREKTATASQAALLDSLTAAIARLKEGSPGQVAGVGIGIPSMIDQQRGRAVMSVNVPLADLDFVSYMEERAGLRVRIDNDANLAALAEARAGAARGVQQAVMITVGTGIGGGLIIDGRVYRGATGSAAELGHMVIDADGPPCQGSCPNQGCFETMASGTALKRYASQLAAIYPDSRLATAAGAGETLDGRLVSRLAADGDAAALKVLERVGHYLGIGMTSLVNIFNPEVFILGGGVMQAGDLVLKPALHMLAERGLRPNRDIVRVTTPRFGPDAGLLGAACLALEAEGRS